MVSIGPVRNVILLGASSLFATFRTICESHGVRCIVITSPDQRQALPQMMADIVTDDIASQECADRLSELLLEGNMLALSFGARWIIKKQIRDRLFRGFVLNAHGTRLPADRGGGGFSWRIMRGDRLGTVVLHQIDDGIDTGPIVLVEEYILPRHVQTPAQHNEFYMQQQTEVIGRFLKKIISQRCEFQVAPQVNFNSTYYPRLDSQSHGWIDWSWPGADIEKFILAFDNPHPGARTCWKNEVVILRDCQLHVGEIGHHPFQRGLIIRNNGRWLTVALDDRYCLLVSNACDRSGRDVLPLIKEGDRFFTAQSTLDRATATRARITPTGLSTQVYSSDDVSQSQDK